MNLQITPKVQNRIIKNDEQGAKGTKTTPSFTGAVDYATMALRFLDTNQAWGANFVDLSFMVIPRTTVDFTRGPEAGVETMRREASGTTNHALVGAYGMLAAAAVSQGFNGKFGIKANKLFVGNDTLDVMAKAWHEEVNVKKAADPVSSFLDSVLDKFKGFSPEKGKTDAWKTLDDASKAEIKKVLQEQMKNDKLSKESLDYLKAVVMRSLGAESRVKLDGAGDVPVATLLDNIHKVSKAFTSEKVKSAFTSATDYASNTFVKGMKGLNLKTSLLGLGLGVLFGVSVQPINMYLTKLKTGKSGFVGVEGREPDKSSGFKLTKLLAAGAFGTMALRIIGKPSEILGRVQFKGFNPTINQLKVVYGLTIMSRLLSARDKNELRESTIKDTLGFLNLLVLGNIVSNWTAIGFEKLIKDKNNSLINYSETEGGRGWFNKLTKATRMTRDEILHSELKKVGIETVKDGKVLPMKELLRLAKEHAPIARTKIKYLNLAQLVGYAYSGLALGIGIPKLNIYITNKLQKKQKGEPSKIADSKLPEVPKKPEIKA